MKIKLIFHDWWRYQMSVYDTKVGFKLSSRDFHSGTTFDGEMLLNPEQEQEIKRAIKNGYNPVFCVDEYRKSREEVK